MRLLLPLLLAMEHPAWLAEKIASGCIIQKEVKFKGGSAAKIITKLSCECGSLLDPAITREMYPRASVVINSSWMAAARCS